MEYVGLLTRNLPCDLRSILHTYFGTWTLRLRLQVRAAGQHHSRQYLDPQSILTNGRLGFFGGFGQFCFPTCWVQVTLFVQSPKSGIASYSLKQPLMEIAHPSIIMITIYRDQKAMMW